MWKLSKYSKLNNCSALTSSFILTYLLNNPSLRQNCPYSEFSLIWTECAEILHILMQKKKGKGSKVLTNNLLRSQAHEKKNSTKGSSDLPVSPSSENDLKKSRSRNWALNLCFWNIFSQASYRRCFVKKSVFKTFANFTSVFLWILGNI